MAKYIENKNIDINKFNNILELKDIGKAAWKFLSAIYSLRQDFLIADNSNNSFKQKLLFKFTPKINPVNTSKKENKNMDKPTSVERLLPYILAKLPKEVNELSKCFKITGLTKPDNNKDKSYAQALKSRNTTKKVFKIKEAFSSFKVNKIDNIQKIIKDNNKPKLRINMITKGLSKKQVIVPINNDNKTKFIEDSSNHITNLNRVMKNIRSNTMVDFIQLENSSIIIVTNKVVLALELQTIENYYQECKSH